MPFQSQQQRRWMHMKHPDMAARWEKETPKGKPLPKKVPHPGFQAVKAKIARKQGVSGERAAAILAAGARKASPAAVRRNPRLAKVKIRRVPAGKG